MELLDALHWRYATKSMNGQKVPQEKVDAILEAAHLAPSSSGLQPYHIIVITDPILKEKITPIANNQSQIEACSHLLVFAAWDTYTADRISDVFERTTSERGLPANQMEDYKNRLIAGYPPRPVQVNFEHAARQAYISFGFAIVAAATLQVDATPMEGFNNAALDELLGLNEKGLKSVVILPLGYRKAENDWLVKLKKVRTAKEKFFTFLS